MDSSAYRRNVAILAQVELLGGDYVWEPEVFAVGLVDVPVDDDQALRLCELVGVQQIAIDASRLATSTLEQLALTPGLSSLVVLNRTLSQPERLALEACDADVRTAEW